MASPNPAPDPPARLERLEESVLFVERNVEQVSESLADLSRRLETVTQRLARLEERLGHVEERSIEPTDHTPEVSDDDDRP